MHASRRVEVQRVTSEEPDPTSIKSCIIAAKLRGSLWLPTSSGPLRTRCLSVVASPQARPLGYRSRRLQV